MIARAEEAAGTLELPEPPGPAGIGRIAVDRRRLARGKPLVSQTGNERVAALARRERGRFVDDTECGEPLLQQVEGRQPTDLAVVVDHRRHPANVGVVGDVDHGNGRSRQPLQPAVAEKGANHAPLHLSPQQGLEQVLLRAAQRQQPPVRLAPRIVLYTLQHLQADVEIDVQQDRHGQEGVGIRHCA